MSDKASVFSTTSSSTTATLVNKGQKSDSFSTPAQKKNRTPSPKIGDSASTFARESQKQGWSSFTATRPSLG
ncbi:unnamed protein product [Somion occarium]|uniref:Uncharacterized protein n=1 Tax=Somion occarium TaxID=3059160 RepID=A0ABP1E2S3_9APHY